MIPLQYIAVGDFLLLYVYRKVMARCKKNLKYICVLKKMLNFAPKYD